MTTAEEDKKKKQQSSTSAATVAGEVADAATDIFIIDGLIDAAGELIKGLLD